ncbi:hypothetical protein ACTQ4E_15485, partial [Lawsonibacter sp. LCP25S3_G6]|uniref:hypothetical protein n=1 Tax=unclassified Lawsonibacter TaxID=2617946 RepID=UPI003F97E40E
LLAPFECLCGNFILPEPASYVFFYAIFNLRNLLYLIFFCPAGCQNPRSRITKAKEILKNLCPAGS